MIAADRPIRRCHCSRRDGTTFARAAHIAHAKPGRASPLLRRYFAALSLIIDIISATLTPRAVIIIPLD
jgi:hypothetical protein